MFISFHFFVLRVARYHIYLCRGAIVLVLDLIGDEERMLILAHYLERPFRIRARMKEVYSTSTALYRRAVLHGPC